MDAKRATVKIGFDGTRLYADIAGEIDHYTAAAVREQIDGQMFRLHPRVLVMRLDGVTFMDSSGLGLVVGRLRVARELGSELRITGADRQKMRIFSLAGLERMPGLKIEQASGL